MSASPAGGLEPKVRVFSFSPTLKVGDVVWVGNDEQGVECLVTGRDGDQLTLLPVPRRPPHVDEVLGAPERDPNT